MATELETELAIGEPSQYDKRKILSLKLASLSWLDRFYILSKLPSEERKWLKGSIKFAQKLGKDTIQKLLADIHAEQKAALNPAALETEAVAAVNSKDENHKEESHKEESHQENINTITCPVLKKHIQKISEQEILVTEHVRQLLLEGNCHVGD